jgi:hypothetical protein
MATVFERKENIVKWFKRMIGRWAYEYRDTPDPEEAQVSTGYRNKLVSASDVESDEGLNITVRQAIGGRVVTFRHYDRKTDRNNNRIYVIPDDLDFERELGKMITLESMR